MTLWVGKVAGLAMMLSGLDIAAVQFTDSVGLGTLILAVAGGIIATYFGAKQKAQRDATIGALKAAQAAAEAWKEERDAEQSKAGRLETELAECKVEHNEEILRLSKELAEAQARTDITRVEAKIESSYREAVAERDLQHRERLAIIEQVRDQSGHTVEVLVAVKDSLDALTQAIHATLPSERSTT